MSQPLSLKGMYEAQSARFRDLNRRQYGFDRKDRPLTPEEAREQIELNVKARFGLFDSTASVEWLESATDRYKKFREDPQYERKRDELLHNAGFHPERR